MGSLWDSPPPHHQVAAHSSCGSTFPVFNFSALIPAIIIVVIIIYGVLTEGLATRQIKRCDTCLPAVVTIATSSLCSLILKDFSFPWQALEELRQSVRSIYNSVSLGAVAMLFLRLHSSSPESESECAQGSTVQHIPHKVLRSKEKCSRKTIAVEKKNEEIGRV